MNGLVAELRADHPPNRIVVPPRGFRHLQRRSRRTPHRLCPHKLLIGRLNPVLPMWPHRKLRGPSRRHVPWSSCAPRRDGDYATMRLTTSYCSNLIESVSAPSSSVIPIRT